MRARWIAVGEVLQRGADLSQDRSRPGVVEIDPRHRLNEPRSAARAVRLVDQLCERALEALEHQVKVEDLVDRDRLGLRHRLLDELRRAKRLLHRAAGDREHDDERHLALRACDLEMKSLVLVAEDLDVAALQAALADRTVVEAGPVANELDDAHRSDPYYAARLGPNPLTMPFDAGTTAGPDDGRMHRPGGQLHAVSRLQLEAPAVALQDEGDRPVDAVEDLFEGVAVRGVAVARAV